jgi:hypothetical protein
MPIPSVDVVTGIVTNGPLRESEPFRWTCVEFSANITVTAQPAGNPWFTPNPASFTAPDGSATAVPISLSPVGGWSWTASGVQINAGVHVVVAESLSKHSKKAS